MLRYTYTDCLVFSSSLSENESNFLFSHYYVIRKKQLRREVVMGELIK